VRSRTLKELADQSQLYSHRPPYTEQGLAFVEPTQASHVDQIIQALQAVTEFDPDTLEAVVRQEAERQGLGLGKIAQPLRVALAGHTVSPSIFEMMAVLGQEESLKRFQAFIQDCLAA
jgi:glutamyl-tRNA synthetase